MLRLHWGLTVRADEVIRADSFLEFAFLRWVLQPAVAPALLQRVIAQHEVAVGERRYRVDYAIVGAERPFVVELDGFAFHSSRQAFTYDRLRQNDLQATGLVVARFSYDAIRTETALCWLIIRPRPSRMDWEPVQPGPATPP